MPRYRAIKCGDGTSILPMTLANGKVKTQREIHHESRQRCNFCNHERRTLYSYDDSGQFCNVDCHDAKLAIDAQSPAFKRKVTITFQEAELVLPGGVASLAAHRHNPRSSRPRRRSA